MYVIKFNNSILHDLRIPGRVLRAPTFHLAVNEAGTGSFIIDPDHPAIGSLKRMRGTVELLSDGVPVFRGRILRDTADFYNSRTIDVEGALAYLNDSLVPPFDYPGGVPGAPEADSAENTVKFFLSWVLDQHNSQVTAEQQIKLGLVTVTDPNNYISRSSENYLTPFEVINSRLLDTMGGYFLMRYEADGNYLDYYEQLPLTNTQPVRFAHNLLDLVHTKDGTELYTAILPIGADKITIQDAPDGDLTPDLVKDGAIIYSKSGRAEYGNICRLVEFSDVTVVSNLVNKAARQLALGLNTEETIECKALDLGFSDADVQKFRVGRNVITDSSPHGLDISLPLLELEIDVEKPAETEIVLGASSASFIGSTIAQGQEIEKIIKQQRVELDDVVGSIESLATETSEQITEMLQTSRRIIFEALEEYTRTSDFEAYRETVTSQFEQVADAITLSINTVTEEITRVDNDAQMRINDITKYFRFTDQGLFIGETGNEVLLQLDNDTIQFLRNNFAELWMGPSGVHADSVDVRRIQIGSFELVEEGGRLTLRKADN